MSRIGVGEKKYVLIPETKPLFAMARVFGPKMGPLSKPTPVLIDVIGDLLRQTGKNALTIYEVIPVVTDKKTGQIKQFSDPVKLTLGNYQLKYEQIVNGVSDGEPFVKAEAAPKGPINVQPEIVTKTVVDPKVGLNPVAGTEAAPVNEEAPADPVESEEETVPVAAVVEPETAGAETESDAEEPVERAVPVDPWPGMTDEARAAYAAMSKSERKAARRAHREQLESQSASSDKE
jgi:hypothetical protein